MPPNGERKIPRRAFLELARDTAIVGTYGWFKLAAMGSTGVVMSLLNSGCTPDGVDPLPSGQTEVANEPLTPDQEFDAAMFRTFPPLDFYNCNAASGGNTIPTEAQALQLLQQQGCQTPLDLKAQLTQDPAIVALSTLALPATALDPIPGDEAIVIGLLILAAAGVMLASVAKGNKINIPTSHSSPSHDPKHPNGGPARNIINTIVTGGVERFCYSAKMIVHNTEIVRHIVTTGVLGADYLAHLAWFDQGGWGGAYTIKAHPRDINAIAETSQYIAEVLVEACPSLPAANQYR